MTNDCSSSCTLVIPTHNRPNVLLTSLKYYESLPLNVLVLDSSAVLAFVPDRVGLDHRHLPGYRFTEKMRRALEEVATPFVAVAADDDFFVAEPLLECIAHMQANPFVAASFGRIMEFEAGDPRHLFDAGPHRSIRSISGVPEERVRTLMSSYNNILWGVFRTDDLRFAYTLLAACQFSNDNFIELILATCLAWRGNIHYSNRYLYLREQTPASWGRRQLNLAQISTSDAFVTSCASIRSALDSGLEPGVFDKGLAAYLATFKPRPSKRTLTSLVRGAVPTSLRAYLRQQTAKSRRTRVPELDYLNDLRRYLGASF